MYVLRTGGSDARRNIPSEIAGYSGVSARRRLRGRTQISVWPRLHTALLTELRRAHLLNLDDCAVDGSHVRALKGGSVGPSSVDRTRLLSSVESADEL
jgi:hypothetical protein